ncbi:hypothetical protein EV702DRAFT_1140210 [Suillus placidus]|uniref:Uncharacterized protein n=1 Tax=Suillus placidus TaxID=48579 RepID=A0A9P6ZL98_9AGAM|nr:hypothetical protein EV702DRAFT_1140210 [Suillus placidus]
MDELEAPVLAAGERLEVQVDHQIGSESEIRLLSPDDVRRCYEIICATNKKLELELEKVGPRGREDYDKDLRGWKTEAQKLGNSKPRTRKMAFIGRTGAGKSTAMNAILGAPVLSTRADTEVFHEDLPPSAWRAIIKFVGKDEWKKVRTFFSPDMRAANIIIDVYVLGGGTSNIGHGIHDDSGPAMDAWDALKEESPTSYFGTITRLRALPFPPPRQDIHVLLEHELIATKLGTEVQRNGLRPYMTAHTKIVEGEPLEWHLVDSIRIYGAFEVLASGAVTLVDVPGFGDANKTRFDNMADIKRAADDQAMRDYFVKFLRRMIRIDGSMESLMVLLTGADVRINEDQLHHLDSKQRHVIQQMCQEIDRLSDNLDQQKKEVDMVYIELGNLVAQRDGTVAMSEIMGRIQCNKTMTDQTARQLQLTKAAIRHICCSHQRSAHVRDVFLQLYHQVYHNINKQNPTREPPPLLLFCIGSMDFDQLMGANNRHRAPLVFTNPEDTGIPKLRRHIHDFGCRNALFDIKAHVHSSTLLCEEIESFFLSARQDLRLTAYENVARGFAEGLKDTVDEIRQNLGGKMDNIINELESALKLQAEKAAKRSIDTIKTLGENYRWHSYRALMRRGGEWGSVDLNEDLVQGMLDGAVSSLWHNFFTEFIRSELQSLVVAVSNKVDIAILSIKNRAQRMTTIAPRINNACNLIHPWDMINPAREAYLSAILSMQKEFCGSFKGLLREELEGNYHAMASESGPGMFQRMKGLNEKQFSPENAQELYARLVNQVMTAIRIARNKGEAALDEALGRLYSSMERSLVCVQGNDQISKAQRGKMQKFLEEECSKPLTEVMTITGQNMPMLR